MTLKGVYWHTVVYDLTVNEHPLFQTNKQTKKLQTCQIKLVET